MYAPPADAIAAGPGQRLSGDPEMGRLMQVGELADRLDITPRTVRYYERLGLLQPARRTDKGYRYYDESAIARLRRIRRLQGVGFSLAQIGQIIDIYAAETPGRTGNVLGLLRSHLMETEVKIAELSCLRDELVAAIRYLGREESGCGARPAAERPRRPHGTTE